MDLAITAETGAVKTVPVPPRPAVPVPSPLGVPPAEADPAPSPTSPEEIPPARPAPDFVAGALATFSRFEFDDDGRSVARFCHAVRSARDRREWHQNSRHRVPDEETVTAAPCVELYGLGTGKARIRFAVPADSDLMPRPRGGPPAVQGSARATTGQGGFRVRPLRLSVCLPFQDLLHGRQSRLHAIRQNLASPRHDASCLLRLRICHTADAA